MTGEKLEGVAFGRSAKIDVLMNEYNALRSEIVSRNGHAFQIASVALIALTWVLSNAADISWTKLTLAGVLILGGFVGFSFVNVREITRLSRQLKLIETKVNEIAQEKLLTWETTNAPMAGAGWFRSIFSRRILNDEDPYRKD